MPEERRFVGFDAYKKAMDCLKPGDVVILDHAARVPLGPFGYAIEKGLNVFMEKPITVDGPSTKKMLKLAEESVKKNLKVGVGLMCRHCPGPPRTVQAHQGRRDRRPHAAPRPIACMGRSAPASPVRCRRAISELLYQIRRFHSFLWASGGCYSDFYIHTSTNAAG